MSNALTSGTTDQDGRDAAGTQTTGTPGAAGADAGEGSMEALRAENARLRDAQDKALAEKSTLEATKRENEALRARLSAPPTGAGAVGTDPRLVQQQAFMGRLQQHAAAAAADPGSDSALVVGLYAQNQELARRLENLGGLISVPADEQAKVRDLQNQYAQQGETISAATARRILKADQLEASQSTVEAKAKEQEAAEEARRNGVVATRTVGATRSDVIGKTMTMADWEGRIANMTPAELRAFDRKLEENGTRVLPE